MTEPYYHSPGRPPSQRPKHKRRTKDEIEEEKERKAAQARATAQAILDEMYRRAATEAPTKAVGQNNPGDPRIIRVLTWDAQSELLEKAEAAFLVIVGVTETGSPANDLATEWWLRLAKARSGNGT